MYVVGIAAEKYMHFYDKTGNYACCCNGYGYEDGKRIKWDLTWKKGDVVEMTLDLKSERKPIEYHCNGKRKKCPIDWDESSFRLAVYMHNDGEVTTIDKFEYL